MNFIKTILNPNYWIAHQTSIPDTWKYGLLIFFGLFVMLGIVSMVLHYIKKLAKPWRVLFARISIWAWVMGLLGLVLLFFSLERVWIISARIFYLFWLLIAVWWAYYIVRYAVKDLPRILQAQKERKEREKYLPKRKK